MADRFVWVKERGLVRPEFWPHDAPTGCVERTVVAEHKLSGLESAMTLDMLATRYPAPGNG